MPGDSQGLTYTAVVVNLKSRPRDEDSLGGPVLTSGSGLWSLHSRSRPFVTGERHFSSLSRAA